MSDGGGERGREHEQHNRTQRKTSGDDFARAIAKIAVAQVCEIVGFQTFQLSALETLSDVAVHYIHNIGKTAHFYANLSGRMDCNVFDIIQGLEDLGMAQGFAGASDVDHCLASSGTVREIAQYVGETEHIPFSYSIPQFPVVKDRKLTLSFLQSGVETPGGHIPIWLPAFPEPHTYVQSPISNETARELHTDMIEQKKKNREMWSGLYSICSGGWYAMGWRDHLLTLDMLIRQNKQEKVTLFLLHLCNMGRQKYLMLLFQLNFQAKQQWKNLLLRTVLRRSVLQCWRPLLQQLKQ